MGEIKTETRAYHHEGIGGVERLIRVFINRLRCKLTDRYDDSWDRNIPEILLSMRNTMNQASGRSPAQLVYGRNLRLPVNGRGTSWMVKNIKSGWSKKYVKRTKRNYDKTIPKRSQLYSDFEKVEPRASKLDKHNLCNNIIDVFKIPFQMTEI
ncbi:hypothetical protein A3Q56_07422 [Intoshia linei]|uniref:Integrase catalytic domain-containing protein n=1 Tax=Intoshia linei TaxID=1819745 RepID=A0A177AU27_9BILA|nr:hypothetical protein A3Q56_07422 [Intoshia linei]